MKFRVYLVCMIILSSITLVSCNKKDTQEDTTGYDTATLFCDVSWWEPPMWNEEPGTITGDISARTGLSISVIQPTQKADTQLKIMLLNDKLPDIISVTDSTTISQLVGSDKVWRIDEFLEKYKPDSHILKDFPEDVKKELIKRDGGWYAYPSHINSADARNYWKPTPDMEDVAEYSENNAIMWNTELLEMAGLKLSDLKTQDQIMEAFAKVKKMKLKVEGEDVITLLVDGKGYDESTLSFLEQSFGAEQIDEEGNYCDILLQPQTKNALSFLNEAIRKQYITHDQLTMETMQIQELMQSGRVLCFIGNSANTKADMSKWISTGSVLSSDGSTPVMGKNMRATTGWISTFIAKSCNNPEKIADFLDYMTSDEGMTFWAYGYEGKDYYIGEDGLYYRTDKNAAKYYENTGINVWWMFVNTAWERSVAAQENDEAAIKIMTAYGKDSATVMYDNSLLIMPGELTAEDKEEAKIEEEIQEWKSDQVIQVVLAEDKESFEQEYDKFIKGLYDIGIEKLMQYKNKGYQQNCLEYGEHIEKINK